MEFEWDDEKAAINLRKHGISFSVSRLVFRDPLRIEVQDESVDYGEERWLTVGLIAGAEIAVVFTMRDNRIRLISARKATRDERKNYWANR